MDEGEDEDIEAEKGYKKEVPYFVKVPNILGDPDDEEAREKLLLRHKTVNWHFKQFDILKKVFCHDRNKHSHCFRAIAAITQLHIMKGEDLFSVEYSDL